MIGIVRGENMRTLQTIIISTAVVIATGIPNISAEAPLYVSPSTHAKYKLIEQLQGAGNLGSTAPNNKLDKLFRKVGLNGKKVMDLGCGLGGYTLHLAKQFSAEIVGVDPDAQYIEQAKKNHSQASNLKGKVDFRVMQNRLNLKEYDTDSFDVILAKQVLFEVNDKTALIKEVKRVLKPNGLLVLVDLVKGKTPGQPSTPSQTPESQQLPPPAPATAIPEHTAKYHAIWGEQPDNTTYHQMLSEAELETIQDDDISQEFVNKLDEDINSASHKRPALEVEFGQAAFNDALQNMENQRAWLKQHKLEAHIMVGRKKA